MTVNKNSDQERISKIRDYRKTFPTLEELIQGIYIGDASALARAITLVESTREEDLDKANTIIEKCLTRQSESVRIGITGVPGVGKSTFIENFGGQLTALGKKVAVLAVDPSSTLSKGSILGDKTRMAALVKDKNAFIRPSASGGTLGGVSRKTRETITLCEAAGYDVVLVETVGVGQSETAVHNMVDFFLLLKLPGAGDELQGIKRGIIEMADTIVINKADGDNINSARIAAIDFSRALHLYPPKADGWVPKVVSCSALENTGLIEIWALITEYIGNAKKSGSFNAKRQLQNKNWLLQTLDEQLKLQFYQDEQVKNQLEKIMADVMENKISPFRAAELLFQSVKRN
ncbi:MAG: methylmalonyl Co-A mutase-associated GTPase MeaB [Flavobacteriaceae bacterium]